MSARRGTAPDGRALHAVLWAWAGCSIVGLAVCLVICGYTLVVGRAVPGVGIFTIPAIALFVVGVVFRGGRGRWKERQRDKQLPGLGGLASRVAGPVFFGFVIIAVTGFVPRVGYPGDPQPGCAYPLFHNVRAPDCVTETEYRAVQAVSQRVSAGVAGSGITLSAEAALVLASLAALDPTPVSAVQ